MEVTGPNPVLRAMKSKQEIREDWLVLAMFAAKRSAERMTNARKSMKDVLHCLKEANEVSKRRKKKR